MNYCLSQDATAAAYALATTDYDAEIVATSDALEAAVFSRAHNPEPTGTAYWARKSRKNFEWLATYSLTLLTLYRRRHARCHPRQQVVIDICRIADKLYLPDGPLTPPIINNEKRHSWEAVVHYSRASYGKLGGCLARPVLRENQL